MSSLVLMMNVWNIQILGVIKAARPQGLIMQFKLLIDGKEVEIPTPLNDLKVIISDDERLQLDGPDLSVQDVEVHYTFTHEAVIVDAINNEAEDLEPSVIGTYSIGFDDLVNDICNEGELLM